MTAGHVGDGQRILVSPRGRAYRAEEKKAKKLSVAAKVSEATAKKWLIRQALCQIYLPAQRRISRPKFNVPTPNKVHQADDVVAALNNKATSLTGKKPA